MENNPILVPLYYPEDVAKYIYFPKYHITSLLEKNLSYARPLINRAAIYCYSFANVIELFLLMNLLETKKFEVELYDLFDALVFLEKEYKSEHPLILSTFCISGLDLFIDNMANVSPQDKLEMQAMLTNLLTRIGRYENGVATKFYPFLTKNQDDDRKPISVSPCIQGGRACVDGTGAPTEEIADRFLAGDRMVDIADDFGITLDKVEFSILFEYRTCL